jgi:hypothetical protein
MSFSSTPRCSNRCCCRRPMPGRGTGRLRPAETGRERQAHPAPGPSALGVEASLTRLPDPRRACDAGGLRQRTVGARGWVQG